MQEMQVWSLGWEGPLKEEMESHSSFLIWEIPRSGGAWRVTVHGFAKELDTTQWLNNNNNLELQRSSWNWMKGQGELRDPSPKQLSANSENKLQLLQLYFLLLWPKVIPALHNGLFLFLLLNYSITCVKPGNLPLFSTCSLPSFGDTESILLVSSHLQALCPNTGTHIDWQSEDRACRVRIRGTGGKEQVYLLLSEVVLILETQHSFSENSKDCVFGKDYSFFIFLTNVLRDGKDKSECHPDTYGAESHSY